MNGQNSEKKSLPELKVARQSTIDVTHISLDLTVNWEDEKLSGSATIDLKLLKPSDKIFFDAGMLNISKVFLGNSTNLVFKYDSKDSENGLEIQLDKMYAAQANLKIKIDYSTNYRNETDPNNLWGSNGKGLRFMKQTTSDPYRKKQIWSSGETDGNRYWFPCFDAPNDLRTTSVSITVEKIYNTISNGELISVTDVSNNKRMWCYEMNIPYANHLTSIVIGEYTDVKLKYGNISLHNFSYLDQADATKASVARLPDMIKFIEEKTGVKYPLNSYSQIFVQDYGSNSGNISASTITENMVDDGRTHNDFYYLWDITEGESIAAQWFGGIVTAESWSDVWLNKSFARYFSGLYNEYKNGEDEFLMYQNAYDQSMYFFDWNNGNKQPIVNKQYEDADQFCQSNYPYLRGAAVLQTLRKELGDEKWWKAISHYLNNHSGKTVTTNDLKKSVEAVCNKPMDWFFNQWIYETGHPVFVINKNYDESKKQLSLSVKQIQQQDSANLFPQVKYFQGSVSVAIDNKIEKVWLDAKEENIFTFNCSQNPRIVNFDKGGAWIKETTFEKSLDELLYQFQNDDDIIGRVWSMNELKKIEADSLTTFANKEKIHVAYLRVIDSKAYWRFRMQAITQLQSMLIYRGSKPLDEKVTETLLKIIANDAPWVRRSAIFFLGLTRDDKYVDLYLKLLNDSSDRVINAAAIALGQSKSKRAFDALVKLIDKPSWKNQSLISALWGLKELDDERAYDVALKAATDLASPHWTLATPVWDYRYAAINTIVAFGKSYDAYPSLRKIFDSAIAENDLQAVIYNTLLITTLNTERGLEIFPLLKEKYKDHINAMAAIENYEMQLKQSLNKN